MSPSCVAVTGASGMLGAHVCAFFRDRGWRVHALLRRPDALPEELSDVPGFRYELREALAPASLEGVDVVIHCAATTRAEDLASAGDLDEAAARRLLEAARAAGVGRVVFPSSTSARADAPSTYGRSKFGIERRLDPDRDVALRLGLVVSSTGGGLFRRLVDLIAGARLVPLFGGGAQRVQPIHVDDVCRAIEGALDRGVTGTLTVADPEGLAFRELLEEIAARLGRRVTFLPLPYGPVLFALRITERLHLPAPITSENLLGLREQRFHECRADLERLDVRVMGVARALDLAIGGAVDRAG